MLTIIESKIKQTRENKTNNTPKQMYKQTQKQKQLTSTNAEKQTITINQTKHLIKPQKRDIILTKLEITNRKKTK